MTCNNADIREHHCLNWSCTELPPLTLLSHHNLEIWSHWCLGSPPTDNNYMIVGGSQTFHNWRRVEIDKLTDPSYGEASQVHKRAKVQAAMLKDFQKRWWHVYCQIDLRDFYKTPIWSLSENWLLGSEEGQCSHCSWW